MITASLPAITDRWKAFWPINELRPLAVLDYISYFLLIKKLDDEQLVMERSGKGNEMSFIYQQQQNELRWHVFKDMEAKSLYTLFTKENGVIDFMQRYGQTDHLYSQYLKHPLLVTPTPNLLANTVNIIKLLAAEDNIIRAEIFEYLLYEQQVAGQNGQVFAPATIVKLLVAMMNPTADDVIWDPSVGNGSFLVNSVKYILNNKSAWAANNIREDNFKGMDFDPVLLRIAAVNMMLNGIDTPALETVNSQDNFTPGEQPTIILSNLFFKASEDKLTESGTSISGITGKKEAAFLQLIMKSIKPGIRAAVIVPENILYDNAEELTLIRRQIIDENKLEAVISLPGADSLFSGAAILVFNRSNSNVTDKVWFYKMKDVTTQVNNEEALYSGNKNISGFSGEQVEVLILWDNLNKGNLKETPGKSFFVTADVIKDNNYSLSYKEYKRSAKPPDFNTNADIVIKTPAEATIIKSINPHPAPVIINEDQIAEEAPVKKGISFIPILLMIIFGAAISLSFLYFISKKEDPIAGTKQPTPAAAVIPKTDQQQHEADTILSGALSPDKKDGINISSRTVSGANTASNKTEITNLPKPNAAPAQVVQDPDITAVNNTTSGQRYTVIQKAYFHNQPDKSTRRKGYIIHWNNAVLKPLDEKDGFIYIVFTNHRGQTSKGWLDKNDLRPLR